MHGQPIDSRALIRLLDHHFAVNRQRVAGGRAGVPLCIWGPHGIGKTQVVADYARAQGWSLRVVPPAQFEETGDLLGMPVIERGMTRLQPPEWAPAVPGPGILLLDDFNRADERILRALMQLLESGRLISWGLPPDWQIVLTANPDTGDYSVTPLDDAILTRMLHVELRFDLGAWLEWALGYGLDDRMLAFAGQHPEWLNGRRSTPRTLVQFFDSIAGIPDWRAEPELVRILATAALDQPAVAAFLAFVQAGGDRFPGPAAILEAADFPSAFGRPLERYLRDRKDKASVLFYWKMRMLHYLRTQQPRLSEKRRDNLKAFLLWSEWPADLRQLLATELLATGHPQLEELIADPEVARRIL